MSPLLPLRRRRMLAPLEVRGVTTAPDAVRRDGGPVAPNRLWIADIGSLRTDAGWLHLAAVLDCYSRRCLGWELRDRFAPELLSTAVERAVGARWPSVSVAREPGRLGHDVPLALARRCELAGIAIPRGAQVATLDGAVAEAFFAMLSRDLVGAHPWPVPAAVGPLIAEWIERYYNPKTGPVSTGGSISQELDELSL